TCRLPIYPQDPTSAFTASARAPRGNPFRATPVTDQNGSIHRHTQAPQRSGEEAHRMTQRRIGLIGYGDVSVVHVEAIQAIDGLELVRSEEHTSELQSRENIVCRLLLEKKKYTT